MEALVFMIDSVVMILLVFGGLRDDRKPAGTPQTSLFRTTEDDAPSPSRRAVRPPWEMPAP